MASRISAAIPRYYHTSAQVANKVVACGGITLGVAHTGWTRDHSVQRKKQLTALVNVFDPYTEEWEVKESTGDTPTPGVHGAAGTSSNGVLFTYGGRDDNDTLVDSLHQLSLKTYRWDRLPAKGQAPMPKKDAAMVPCGSNLALFGGYGVPQRPIQSGSSFYRNERVTDGRGWTNEFHIYHPYEGYHAVPS